MCCKLPIPPAAIIIVQERPWSDEDPGKKQQTIIIHIHPSADIELTGWLFGAHHVWRKIRNNDRNKDQCAPDFVHHPTNLIHLELSDSLVYCSITLSIGANRITSDFRRFWRSFRVFWHNLPWRLCKHQCRYFLAVMLSTT